MEELLRVHKADKRGRLRRGLRHVVDLQPLAFVGRRLNARRRLREDVVQRAGRDAHRIARGHLPDQLEKAVEPLAGLCGDEDDRRIGHEGEILLELRAVFLHRLVVLFDGVPLIDRDDAALARLVRDAGDLRILLGEADRRVDQDHADVGAVDRHLGAQIAVVLDGVLHLALAAQAGRIDERERAEPVLDRRIHGVARRARDVGDDAAVLAGNAVDERRLADVRLADDRHLDDLALLFVLRLLGQMLEDGVQQVAGAVAVHRRNLNRVAEAEVVELIEIDRRLAERVAFVDADDHRHIAALEHLRDVEIRRHHARAHVGHKDDDVRRVDRDLRLRAHLREDDVLRFRLDAARIDEREAAVFPLALAEDAVARDARRILHNGKALSDQLVEQSRFADIRSADNRHDRFGHSVSSFTVSFPAAGRVCPAARRRHLSACVLPEPPAQR